MKRLLFIVAILAVCIFQGWAQSVPDTLLIPAKTCDGVPYYYPKQNGLIIECMPGLQCVDTIQMGSIVFVVYVNLEILDNPVYHKYEYARLCQNKSLNFHNNIIHGWDFSLGNDTLHFNVPSAETCDTLMTLILTVVPTYDIIIPDTICTGEEYYENGFGLPPHSTAGTFYYTKTLPTHYPNLCDSTVTLKLTVNPQKEITIRAEICEGDTFSGYGFDNLSVQGTYTNFGTSAVGCDSTTILILTVYNFTDTLAIKVCNNELPYIYTKKSNGLRIPLFDEGLQIVDTIPTGSKCDSIIYVNLNVIQNPLYHKYEPLCQNETLNFYNNIIYGVNYPPGDTILKYYVPFTEACDSLFILHLTIKPTYNDTIADSICVGYNYSKNGFELPVQTTAGTFEHTQIQQTHYPNLCDSVITLILTVNPNKEKIIIGEICEGDTYSEYGFNESVPGIYTQPSGTSASGCDSITILILTVYPAGIDINLDEEICEGDVYKEYGFNVSETDIYSKDTTTNDGCPYIIRLNLKVLPNLRMDTLPLGEICGDMKDFPVKYRVIAGNIDTVFVSFDEKAYYAGFEDDVKHNPSNDNIKIKLPPDIRPDNYSATLYFKGRCSDTTFTVNFTVLYPSSVMEQRWNDVIVLKNPAYNGGYDFSYKEWFVNGLPINPLSVFDKGNFIYTAPGTLQFGSEYRVLLTRWGEFQSFCSCPLVPIRHSDGYEFPRIMSGRGKINVSSNDPIVEMNLFNILGQTVRNGRYANNEIEINADAGFYIIRLATDKGQIYTQKIVVQ